MISLQIKKTTVILVLILLIVSMGTILLYRDPNTVLVLSTTTSVENTGVLYALIDDFTEAKNWEIKVIARGSGQAVDLGKKGEVDAILVHAPNLEREFMDEGYGENRTTLWFNYFVIAGPPDDPANVTKASTPIEAFSRIREAGNKGVAEFISRGDNSGTHIKELGLWKTKPNPAVDEWYIESGTGMGATLNLAEEKKAYVLSDFGTFTQFKANEKLPSLENLYSDGVELYNPYSYMVVSSTLYSNLNTEAAYNFLNYLLSERANLIVKSFAIAGEQLFTPVEG